MGGAGGGGRLAKTEDRGGGSGGALRGIFGRGGKWE